MHHRKVSVIGLGYVGLPVAVAFGQTQRVIGFDLDESRLSELREHRDRTNEVDTEELKSVDIVYTSDTSELAQADFHIVAVPTPVDGSNRPNLDMMKGASRTVAQALKQNDVVVFESTVYPGVTMQECVPVLESESGLKCGIDFFVGYSPERINPGDKEHTFTKILKVVAGQDDATRKIVADVYRSVVTAGVYEAASIEVAEAAKVIENTQRDLNIALMNELAIIFHHMGIDTNSVLEAAGTKWNFLKFKPGLVGGHCIGVDPYYLTYKAEQLGYLPQVILAGRRINDGMSRYIGQATIKELVKAGHDLRHCKVTVFGVTFKEDCPDLRNSKVIDVINELRDYNIDVQVVDPECDAEEVSREYGLELKPLPELEPSEALVFAVSHKEFREYTAEQIRALSRQNAIVMDIKSMFDPLELEQQGLKTWRL